MWIPWALAAAMMAAPQSAEKQPPLSQAGASKLKNPVPFTKKSVAQGRTIYLRYCTACHGADGKATVDVVADATDLTSPKLWRHGSTDGEIFRSTRDGAGDSMPAFKTQIPQQEDLWHLVNYVRSLWPESMRPPLAEAGPSSGKSK